MCALQNSLTCTVAIKHGLDWANCINVFVHSYTGSVST